MIKNFIYLDEQKMYSFSSQIFEGITDYVLNESGSEEQKTESQKAKVGSGRLLADVINNISKSTEKRFLHDYSFDIFEKHLMAEKMILTLSEPFPNPEEIVSSINDVSFVKVKANAIFNDAKTTSDLFNQFNNIGEAFAFISNFSEIEELKSEIKTIKSQTKDRNKKAKLQAELNKHANISKLAKEQGLYLDPKFLESLVLITKYGYSDQFEIQQRGEDIIFSSYLKREFLREKEDLLVKKYSRKTEKALVVFGSISQAISPNEYTDPIDELDNDIEDENDPQSMKEAYSLIVDNIINVENTFFGRRENEIVIDPIAAYFEV